MYPCCMKMVLLESLETLLKRNLITRINQFASGTVFSKKMKMPNNY